MRSTNFATNIHFLSLPSKTNKKWSTFVIDVECSNTPMLSIFLKTMRNFGVDQNRMQIYSLNLKWFFDHESLKMPRHAPTTGERKINYIYWIKLAAMLSPITAFIELRLASRLFTQLNWKHVSVAPVTSLHGARKTFSVCVLEMCLIPIIYCESEKRPHFVQVKMLEVWEETFEHERQIKAKKC